MDLELVGPFKWREVFSRPEAKESGVYLWTAQYERKYLVSYVGETGRSFADRFAEHTRNTISGLWDICDPVEFVKGHRKYTWEGRWKTQKLRDPKRAVEFIEKYKKYALWTNSLGLWVVVSFFCFWSLFVQRFMSML
jgi:hypothetical protein